MFTPSAQAADPMNLSALPPLSDLAAPASAAVAPLLRQQAGLRRLASQALFQGQQELLIDHGEAVYRLRITSQGKLILTK